MKKSDIRFKIHEIARPRVDDPAGTPIKVRYKIIEKMGGDFNTTGKFFNREVRIPLEQLSRLTREDALAVIRAKIEEQIDVDFLQQEKDLENLQDLVQEEFEFKEEV